MSTTITWAIISSFGTAILTYLVTYTNAKAKFRAELETISQKTDKQEKVIAKYKLEVAQKSYMHQKKHEVYSKYHNLLDKFYSEKSPIFNDAKLETLLHKHLMVMAQNADDDNKKLEALNSMKYHLKLEVRKAFEGIKDIAKQTNELELIAPIEVSSVVKEIDNNYILTKNLTDIFFSKPFSLEEFKQGILFEPFKEEGKKIYSNTVELKSELIRLMKEDLDKN